MEGNTLSVADVNYFLSKIFKLQDENLSKDLQIIRLEFELGLKTQMLDAFKKYSDPNYKPAN